MTTTHIFRPALDGADPQTALMTDRRRLLAAGLGGAAFATLGGLPISAWAETVDPKLAGKILNLVIRYRTDADRVARMLPPGIEPDEAADVMMDWWVRYPTPGTENVYYPGVYSECGVHVTAKYQGKRGMLQVGMPLDQEWGRSVGRESVGLDKKDGVVRLVRNGNEVTGDLHRRGKLLYRIKTQILQDKPAHPLFWHRETGFGAFLYRYRLNPDWRQGPLSADPVELWLRVLAGKTGAYPTELTPSGPRECDFNQTHFEFVEPSVLDPFSELPMRKIVGISYSETGMSPKDEIAYRGKAPRTPTRIERLQLIDAKAFEPWSMMTYDRPITAGKPWIPAAWPAKNTALKLTADEIKHYRERPSLNRDLTEMVDLQLQVEAAVHARTLPPPLKAGPNPIMRIMAVRVGISDDSPKPYNEMWLFSRCEIDGAEAWYALGNPVGAGGDIVYNRETFGHPSKMATVNFAANGAQRTASATRMEREFVRVSYSAPAAGAAGTAQATIIGLMVSPPWRTMTLTGFTEPGPQASLIAQPWSLELSSAAPIDLTQCRLEFPMKPGPGKVGLIDPWFEFKDGKLISAVAGKGVLRRAPGRTVAHVTDYRPFYVERVDGTDDNGDAIVGNQKHTFLGGK